MPKCSLKLIMTMSGKLDSFQNDSCARVQNVVISFYGQTSMKRQRFTKKLIYAILAKPITHGTRKHNKAAFHFGVDLYRMDALDHVLYSFLKLNGCKR